MSEPVTLTLHADGVAEITLDDGRVNALSHGVINAVHAHLDTARSEARAVLIVGREGKFCAGFDLSVMTAGPESARDLLRAGAELAIRLFLHPQPVVMACTGHGLAMGAILLMSGDIRIGAEGPFKIGLNEVSIGMPVPKFATELARERLHPSHLSPATTLATIYDPIGAIGAGFLDEVTPADDLVDVSRARASTLAAYVTQPAFARTRANIRGDIASAMTAGLDADLADFTVEVP